MRVALDFQPVSRELTGVGQYAYYLAKYLPLLSPGDEFIGLSFGGGSSVMDRFRPEGLRLCRVRFLPRRGIGFLWKMFDWPPADIFTGPVDIFHFPSFIARNLRSARAVVTIHDLAFRRMPDSCEPKNVAFLEKNIPRTLERAKLVLADSEFTARELGEIYHYPVERIRVAHLGVEPSFEPRSPEEADSVRSRYRLPRRFILCVATVEPRKNLGSLVRAYGLLRESGGDVPPLVLVGSEGWRGEGRRLEKIIARLKLARSIVRLDYIGHTELPALYTAADLFVFPSLYEGFGLPPLEAMACGTPVVCSDAASLPEAVGDAALQVPPRDTEAIAGAMRKLLDDGFLRDELIRKGRERAKSFSWIETARKTLEAYRDALEM